MKSVWVIILAIFSMKLFSCGLGIAGWVLGLMFSFMLAFLHDVIGWKKTLVFFCASTLVDLTETFMVNASLIFTDAFLRVTSVTTAFFALFIPAFVFFGTYLCTLAFYCFNLYLIRRWKIHDRCGNIYFR